MTIPARYRFCPDDWEGWEDLDERQHGDPERKLDQAERSYEKHLDRMGGD